MKKHWYIFSLIFFPCFMQAQNVGIGTTTPVTKLNIVGGGSNPAIPGATSAALLRIGVSPNEGIDFGKMGASPYSGWIQAGLDGVFSDGLSLQPMGGNVGIGTLSPGHSLQIHQNAGANGYMNITNTTTGSTVTDGLLIGLAGNAAAITNLENASLQLGTNNASRLTIDNLGKVGIGTSLPAQRFQVYENSSSIGYMSITNLTTGSNATDGLILGLTANTAILKNLENSNMIFGTNNMDILGISPINNGTVIIGNGSGVTVSASGYKLNVHGRIVCTEVMVKDIASWPDYVFSPAYKLMPLSDVKKYIAKNSHLPNLPNAATVEKDGLQLAAMQKKLLEKVEELTLYILQQEDKIKLQQDEILAIKRQLKYAGN